AAPEADPIAIQPIEHGEDANEKDVEEGRVIPLEGRLYDLGRMDSGNQPDGSKQELRREAGDRHDEPERTQDAQGHRPSVKAPVDQEKRKRDEVGEDKANHTAKADSALPERRSQRHVANRADEADDGDERTDDHVLDRRRYTMPMEEDGAH